MGCIAILLQRKWDGARRRWFSFGHGSGNGYSRQGDSGEAIYLMFALAQPKHPPWGRPAVLA